MTSTNDGKEVKINQTSGPKGKAHFIELYKSLDSRLNEAEITPSERTRHLCSAWRKIHNLCLHSTASAHTHLLTWLQQHTAKVVLQTAWQDAERKDDRASLEEAINVLIVETRTAAASRNAPSPAWEAQLVERGQWFKKILDKPWQHPVLTCLINVGGTPPSDDEVVEWLKEERGHTFVVRLQTLAAKKQCEDIAVALVTAVMDRMRRDEPHDHDTKGKPAPTAPTFGDRLKAEAGFTVDVCELLIDIEFVLLHKRDSSRCIALAKQTPLRNSHKLIDRLQSRLDTSPRDKRLWKNCKEVAVLITQMVITRCMVIPQCKGDARYALYQCAHALARLTPPARLPPAAAALAAAAATADHLHTLAAAIDAQLAQKNEVSMKPFVCELYVRAINTGMNELERLKLKTEKDKETRAMEQTLSSWFVQLGAVLGSSHRFKCECALTAFSLHPSPGMYEQIRAAPPLPEINMMEETSSEAQNPEFGSWALDSRSQTNFVKTSETLNIKTQQNQANVLSTAILNEGEALGLSPTLCQDITVLLSGPRVKTLSWDMDRELLLQNCKAYLEKTHGGTKSVTTELKYLNLKPEDYNDLPEEDEDEGNAYYGIEKGYEHLVEPEPEDIWEDAYEHFESADASHSSYETEQTQTQRKKKSKKVPAAEEDDPLSHTAEIKKKEKKERPHSKERSKERKRDKSQKKPPTVSPLEVPPQTDPLELNEVSQKKDKPKKERKKKEKVPKPDKSLSGLIGLKVAEPRKKTKNTVGDAARQRKSSMQSMYSGDVIYDGQFSMDELRSPRSTHSSDSMGLNNEPWTIVNGQVVGPHQSLYNKPHRPPSVSSHRTASPFNPQSPLEHSRNNSPTHISDDVKSSISKLLEFRRLKALEQKRNRTNAIIRPEGITIDNNVSPKGVAIPEIPKTYINKQQSDKLKELTEEVEHILKQRQASSAIPSPVIQYAKKHLMPTSPSQAYHVSSPKYTINRATPAPEQRDRSDRFMDSVNYVSIYDKNEPSHSRHSFPGLATPTTNLPKQQANTADVNYQDYLQEFQKQSSYSHFSEKKEPAKKIIRPTNRVTPVLPKSEHKTSQSAKQMSQKPHGSLNTFSRLSYYKNQQTDMKKTQDALSSTIVSKLDAFVMEHLDKQKSYSNDAQNRNYDIPQTSTKAKDHPTISSILHGNTILAQNQRSKTSLSPLRGQIHQTDQRDFLQFLRRQNAAPEPSTSTSTPSYGHHHSQAEADKSTNSQINHLTTSSRQIVKPKEPKKQKDAKMINIISSSIVKSADPYNTIPKPSKKSSGQEKPKRPEVKAHKSSEPEEWEAVMNALAQQKTPYRGPDALKMALNKSSFERAFEDSLRTPSGLFNSNDNDIATSERISRIEYNRNELVKITKTNSPMESVISITERKTRTVVEISRPKKHSKNSRSKKKQSSTVEKIIQRDTIESDMIKKLMQQNNIEIHRTNSNATSTEIPSKPSTQCNVIIQPNDGHAKMISTQTRIDMTRKDAKHINVTPQTNMKQVMSDSYSKIEKTEIEKHTKDVEMSQFTNTRPKQVQSIVAGIPNSDYDLLDELMDDDLRQEIGELSSDEESYNAAAQNFLKDVKANKKSVSVAYNPMKFAGTNVSPQDMQKLDPLVCKNEIRQPSLASKLVQQWLNKKESATKPAMSFGATNIQNVTTHVVTSPVQVNTYNANMTQITVQPNVYIAAVPQPVQNVMLIPSNLMYENYTTVQTPMQAVSNITPYMPMSIAPNINVYQTNQFVAPAISPLIVSSAVTNVLNNESCVTTVPSQADTTVTASQHSYPSSDLYQPIYVAPPQENVVTENTILEGGKVADSCSIPITNHVENDAEIKTEIKTPSDVNVNKIERKVLIEVQEKQSDEKIDCKRRSQKVGDKELKIQADKERLIKKRMAILNRKISHFGVQTIALGYSPLQIHTPTELKECGDVKKTNADKELPTVINNLQELSKDIESPPTPDSFKENKMETVHVRRILLRSSNKLKNKYFSTTSSKPAIDKKQKATAVVSPDTANDSIENNQGNLETISTQKRVSIRIRNKSVATPKGNKEDNVLNKLSNKKAIAATERQNNKAHETVDGSSQDELFDIEAELAGSTIPKLFPVNLLSPDNTWVSSPETIERNMNESPSISDQEETGSTQLEVDQEISESEADFKHVNFANVANLHVRIRKGDVPSCTTFESATDVGHSETAITKKTIHKITNQTVSTVDDFKLSSKTKENLCEADNIPNLENEPPLYKSIPIEFVDTSSKVQCSMSSNKNVKIPCPPISIGTTKLESVAEKSNTLKIGCQIKNADAIRLLANEDDDVEIIDDVKSVVQSPDTSPTDKAKPPKMTLSADSIKIEEIIDPNNHDPLKKKVRIRLSNGKTFRGTISGSVCFESLLDNPDIKSILMDQFQQPKKLYSLKLSVNKDVATGTKIISQAEPKSSLPVETVSLLSDDEDEDPPQEFETEYGKFKINSINRDMFLKHQNEFKRKCNVKIEKLLEEEVDRHVSRSKPSVCIITGMQTQHECVNDETSTKLNDTNILPSIPSKYVEGIQTSKKLNDTQIVSTVPSKYVEGVITDIQTSSKLNNSNTLPTIPSKYVEGIINDIQNILAPTKNKTEEPIVLIDDDSSNDSIHESNLKPKENIDELKNMLLKDLGVADILPQTSKSSDDVPMTWFPEAIDLTEDPTTHQQEECLSKENTSDEVEYQQIINRKCFVKLVRCDYVAAKSSNVEVNHQMEDPELKPAPISRSGSFSILEDFPVADSDEVTKLQNEQNRSSPIMEMYDLIASVKAKYFKNLKTPVKPFECESEWMTTKKLKQMIVSITDCASPQSIIVPKLTKLVLKVVQQDDLINKYYGKTRCSFAISGKRKLKPTTLPISKILKLDTADKSQNINDSGPSFLPIDHLEKDMPNLSITGRNKQDIPVIENVTKDSEILHTDSYGKNLSAIISYQNEDCANIEDVPEDKEPLWSENLNTSSDVTDITASICSENKDIANMEKVHEDIDTRGSENIQTNSDVAIMSADNYNENMDIADIKDVPQDGETLWSEYLHANLDMTNLPATLCNKNEDIADIENLSQDRETLGSENLYTISDVTNLPSSICFENEDIAVIQHVPENEQTLGSLNLYANSVETDTFCYESEADIADIENVETLESENLHTNSDVTNWPASFCYENEDISDIENVPKDRETLGSEKNYTDSDVTNLPALISSENEDIANIDDIPEERELLGVENLHTNSDATNLPAFICSEKKDIAFIKDVPEERDLLGSENLHTNFDVTKLTPTEDIADFENVPEDKEKLGSEDLHTNYYVTNLPATICYGNEVIADIKNVPEDKNTLGSKNLYANSDVTNLPSTVCYENEVIADIDYVPEDRETLGSENLSINSDETNLTPTEDIADFENVPEDKNTLGSENLYANSAVTNLQTTVCYENEVIADIEYVPEDRETLGSQNLSINSDETNLTPTEGIADFENVPEDKYTLGSENLHINSDETNLPTTVCYENKVVADVEYVPEDGETLGSENLHINSDETDLTPTEDIADFENVPEDKEKLAYGDLKTNYYVTNLPATICYENEVIADIKNVPEDKDALGSENLHTNSDVTNLPTTVCYENEVIADIEYVPEDRETLGSENLHINSEETNLTPTEDIAVFENVPEDKEKLVSEYLHTNSNVTNLPATISYENEVIADIKNVPEDKDTLGSENLCTYSDVTNLPITVCYENEVIADIEYVPKDRETLGSENLSINSDETNLTPTEDIADFENVPEDKDTLGSEKCHINSDETNLPTTVSHESEVIADIEYVSEDRETLGSENLHNNSDVTNLTPTEDIVDFENVPEDKEKLGSEYLHVNSKVTNLPATICYENEVISDIKNVPEDKDTLGSENLQTNSDETNLPTTVSYESEVIAAIEYVPEDRETLGSENLSINSDETNLTPTEDIVDFENVPEDKENLGSEDDHTNPNVTNLPATIFYENEVIADIKNVPEDKDTLGSEKLHTNYDVTNLPATMSSINKDIAHIEDQPEDRKSDESDNLHANYAVTNLSVSISDDIAAIKNVPDDNLHANYVVTNLSVSVSDDIAAIKNVPDHSESHHTDADFANISATINKFDDSLFDDSSCAEKDALMISNTSIERLPVNNTNQGTLDSSNDIKIDFCNVIEHVEENGSQNHLPNNASVIPYQTVMSLSEQSKTSALAINDNILEKQMFTVPNITDENKSNYEQNIENIIDFLSNNVEEYIINDLFLKCESSLESKEYLSSSENQTVKPTVKVIETLEVHESSKVQHFERTKIQNLKDFSINTIKDTKQVNQDDDKEVKQVNESNEQEMYTKSNEADLSKNNDEVYDALNKMFQDADHKAEYELQSISENVTNRKKSNETTPENQKGYKKQKLTHSPQTTEEIYDALNKMFGESERPDCKENIIAQKFVSPNTTSVAVNSTYSVLDTADNDQIKVLLLGEDSSNDTLIESVGDVIHSEIIDELIDSALKSDHDLREMEQSNFGEDLAPSFSFEVEVDVERMNTIDETDPNNATVFCDLESTDKVDSEIQIKDSKEYDNPDNGHRYVYAVIDDLSNNDESTQNLESHFENDDETVIENFEIIVPKHTYTNTTKISRTRSLKRKKDMSDFKTSERKYRKAKHIDSPNIPAQAIVDIAYIKEYKRIMDYCSTVKFSYARPFHIDYIDVASMHKAWPVLKSLAVESKELDNNVTEVLYSDTVSIENVMATTDPLKLTLNEEIINGENVNSYESIDIKETNFKMGFGEKSGRVIQKIETGDKKLSAATLSDVKQYQPFPISELVNVSLNKSHEKETQKVKLSHFMDIIGMKQKVQTFFKKTAEELTTGWLQDKKYKNKDNFLKFPFDLTSLEFVKVPRVESIVNVVQVGQMPMNAAAQNPVTCDPRVTHVSDASPSQCSDNSPGEGPQTDMKTEYTELTTANIAMPMQEYSQHHHPPTEKQTYPSTEDDVNVSTMSIVKIELMEEETSEEKIENEIYENDFSPLPNNNVEYSFEETSNTLFNSSVNACNNNTDNASNQLFNTSSNMDTNFTNIFTSSTNMDNSYTNLETSSSIDSSYASMENGSTSVYTTSSIVGNSSNEMDNITDMSDTSSNIVNNKNNPETTNINTAYPNMYPVRETKNLSNIDLDNTVSKGGERRISSENTNITTPKYENDIEDTAYDYTYESIEEYAANMENNNNAHNYSTTEESYSTNGVHENFPSNVDEFDSNSEHFRTNTDRYSSGVENYTSTVGNYPSNLENYPNVERYDKASNIDKNLTNVISSTASMLEDSQPQDLSMGNANQGLKTFKDKHPEHGTSKTDQLAHAMSAAGISSESVIASSADELVSLISQGTQSNVNNYRKPAQSNQQINVMTLQQALAHVLPPPLNQASPPENQPNNTVSQQVLHIVQGNNGLTVINKPNGTHLLHIVQNKSNSATNGLSLIDAGLQQGGNQLIHIVNNGNQNNAQFLKRVNLLTNLPNAQGSSEQKMIQLVCKSADGKSIQLNTGPQRSMVLRLHPSTVQTAQKPPEPQDLSSPSSAASTTNNQESSQEIKSRSVYEENYAQFIQNSAPTPGPSTSPCQEKSTSLPKFNQVFGKQSYQDDSEMNHNGMQENSQCPPEENNGQVEQTSEANTNPPLLLRNTPPETTQPQSTPVQQIKQTISPMNIQTVHGGVIYTRQIPVNLGGGQTINLITVPSTEMVEDLPQKQKTEGQFANQEEPSSIIKLVPHQATTNQNVMPSDNNAQAGPSNESNQNPPPPPPPQPQPQPQPVLTQMRIKLPMLSKGPHIVPGTRLVRPSFFQIQRNVISGANQPVYQQLVLTTAPSLGQTIRLPAQQTPQTQSPQAQPILVQAAQHAQPSPHIPVQQVQHAPSHHTHSAQQAPSAPQTPQPASVQSEHTKGEPDSELSNLTLEQLREFDMVLEQVKERSVQPTPSTTPNTLSKPTSADSTDGSALSTTSISESTQQILYSGDNSQPTNVVSYRKSTITSATTSFVRSPDSSGIMDTPSSSTQVQVTHTVTSKSVTDSDINLVTPPKRKKKKKSSSSANTMASLGSPSKNSSLKPQEDEQTTQRILYILAEYKEQVENSPDKNKPAPRRRNQFPPTTGSKRKRSHCSSRSACRREGVESSPMHEQGENGDDSLITLGSEDSSCGTTFSECTDCQESHSPEESPTKVVRRLTFEQETTTQTITQTRTNALPQRNVIVGEGQTITVARTTTAAAAKPTTTVLMPANYLLPVSMIKGGQQIAIMTNRGPKILVGAGDTNAGALLFQRLIGPGLKPVLTRPGVRHIRLPATALHNLQAFNIQTTPVAHVQPPDSTASQAPTPAPPDLVDTRAMSSPWPDREAQDKPDRGSSPDCTEPWNMPSSSIADDYGYEEIVRTDNMERTVLDAIPDRYSPDMEAQRIFDKMFDVDSKKSMYDSPRCGYDIDTSDGDDKPYQQVVQQRKDGRHHRVTHVSTAALRHKYAILEHELRLQKSLSEECEDLGVDSPSASDLFPEADILFGAPSPAHEQTIDQCYTPPPIPMPPSVPQPDRDDQTATDQLVASEAGARPGDLGLSLDDDVGEMVTVGEDGSATIPTINPEEFARSHPNTTFHTEPEEGEITIAQPPFTIAHHGIKRHITFHASRVPGTVVIAPQASVISQAAANDGTVKFTDIDNMINSMPGPQPVSTQSVLVKEGSIQTQNTPKPIPKFEPKEPSTPKHVSKLDSLKVTVATKPLSKFDSLLNESKLRLSNQGSTHSRILNTHSTGHGTQVIRRLDGHRYDRPQYNHRSNSRFHFEEPRPRAYVSDEVKLRNDRAMVESMGDNASSPGQPELFWDSDRPEKRFNFNESEKVAKSPFDELLNDSSAYGPHTRLDSVIKAARPERTYERTSFEGISVSASDESRPLRTYPPKRVHTQHTQDTDRHFTLKATTHAHHHEDRMKATHQHEVGSKRTMPRCHESEGRRRTGRGLVKRGCSCCNGSSAPPKKRSRPKKPTPPECSPTPNM